MKVKKTVMNFEDKIFPSHMHKSFNAFREAGFCSDVVLALNNKEWKVHKTILSAASPYFCAMFNSQFKEARTNRVVLHGVDSDSVSDILDFIYSSRLKLTPSNVFDLMDVSNYLQVSGTKLWINNYLHSNVTVENCVGIYERSVSLQYHDLAKLALVFIRKHFPRVAEQDEFLEASGELMVKLLSSKFLKVQHEYCLIRIIMRWINANRRQRKRYTRDLLNKLELRYIQLQRLTSLRSEDIFMEDNDLANFLGEKIEEWTKITPVERSLRWKTVRYGAEQGVILVIGGEVDDLPTRSVECYTIGYDSWRRNIPQYIHASKGPRNLIPLAGLNLARTNAAVAYDAYNVYVLGGRSVISNLNECEYYNIKTNAWTNMTQLPERLEGGSAVIFEDQVVFIGGRAPNGCSDEVWQWDQAKGKWKGLAPLNYPRAFHCSISYGGYIYTIGGIGEDGETALKSVERYDPFQKKWFELQSMHKARGKFGCALMNNFIYVMGGTDKGSTLRSVEKYSLEDNSWSYLAPMPTPRCSFSVAIYDKKILCISGTNNIHNLRSVDKYSPSSNHWHYLFSVQSPRCGLCAAVLFLPYISRDV